MSTTAHIRSTSCPNCGAPLELADDQRSVQCEFCGSHIERSDDARHLVIKMRGDQPPVFESGDPSTEISPIQAGAENRRGCLVLSLILIVTLAFIGFMLVVTIPRANLLLKSILSGDVDGALTVVPILNKRIRTSGSGVLVPSLSDAPPDIVVLTTHYPMDGSDSEQRLVALSSAEPRLLWTSPPLDQDTYSVPILTGSDMLYTLKEEQLIALHRADGSAAWQTDLPDVISLYLCTDCVRLLGDRLFTLSDDGTLLASDASSGAPLWEAHATQDSPRGLYVLGDRLAFMDRDENNKGLLRLFDPASGEMQTIQPTCPYSSSHLDYADWTTPLYPSPDGATFYVVFDPPGTCIQRWDAGRLEQLWSTEVPGGIDRDEMPLVSDETVYVGGDGQLFALSAATGELRTLLQDGGSKDDYEFVPLAAVGDDLLVRAARQRGSERFEIWLVDRTGSDGVRWQFDLGKDPPLDPPDANTGIIDVDEPVWTWHVVPDGLIVLRFKRASDDVSHAILLETIDLETGTSSGSREILLDISTTILSAPEFTLWRQDTLWMSIEGELLGFDTAAGEIVYRWP